MVLTWLTLKHLSERCSSHIAAVSRLQFRCQGLLLSLDTLLDAALDVLCAFSVSSASLNGLDFDCRRLLFSDSLIAFVFKLLGLFSAPSSALHSLEFGRCGIVSLLSEFPSFLFLFPDPSATLHGLELDGSFVEICLHRCWRCCCSRVAKGPHFFLPYHPPAMNRLQSGRSRRRLLCGKVALGF